MAKRPWIDRMNGEIQAWADWTIKHIHQSNIGFSIGTMSENVNDLQFDGRSPEVMMPRYIAKVDRAYKEMPPTEKTAICYKYFAIGSETEKALTYADDTKTSISTYLKYLEKAAKRVAGVA